MSLKSIRIRATLTALMMAGCMVFAGCSKKAPETNITPDVEPEIETETSEKGEVFSVTVPEESEVVPEPETEKEALVTVSIQWDCTGGRPSELTDNIDITALREVVVSEDEFSEYYDELDNLIYSRACGYLTHQDGTEDFFVAYYFYSLDYNFDIIVEPGMENSQDLQSILAIISKPGAEDTIYGFEDIGRRGQTGIWYAGVCSCRDGEIKEYIVQ